MRKGGKSATAKRIARYVEPQMTYTAANAATSLAREVTRSHEPRLPMKLAPAEADERASKRRCTRQPSRAHGLLPPLRRLGPRGRHVLRHVRQADPRRRRLVLAPARVRHGARAADAP